MPLQSSYSLPAKHPKRPSLTAVPFRRLSEEMQDPLFQQSSIHSSPSHLYQKEKTEEIPVTFLIHYAIFLDMLFLQIDIRETSHLLPAEIPRLAEIP